MNDDSAKEMNPESAGERRGLAVLVALNPSVFSRMIEVPPQGLVLGRDPSQADVTVGGPLVSRRHCLIHARGDQEWWLRDLDSTNGVWVDGRRVEGEVRIGSDQAIGLGRARVPDFVFFLPGDRERSLKRVLPPADQWLIGRALDVDIALPADGTVSLRHARVRADAHGLQVEDLNSRNGTWRNGLRIETARLSPGDVLRVGRTRLRLELLEDGRLMVQRIGHAEGRCIRLRRVCEDAAGVRRLELKLSPSEVSVLTGLDSTAGRVMIELLSGLRRPGGGQVLIDDVPVAVRVATYSNLIGLVSPGNAPDPALTIEQVLASSVALHLPRDLARGERRAVIEATLRLLKLHSWRQARLQQLSPGLRRCAELAAELVTRPGIVLLERPFQGLSEAEAEVMSRLIRRVAHSGRTVVVVADASDPVTKLGRHHDLGAVASKRHGASTMDLSSEAWPDAIDAPVESGANPAPRTDPAPAPFAEHDDETVLDWRLWAPLWRRQIRARFGGVRRWLAVLMLPLLTMAGQRLLEPVLPTYIAGAGEAAWAIRQVTWLAAAALLFGALAARHEFCRPGLILRRERQLGVHPLVMLSARWLCAALVALIQTLILTGLLSLPGSAPPGFGPGLLLALGLLSACGAAIGSLLMLIGDERGWLGTALSVAVVGLNILAFASGPVHGLLAAALPYRWGVEMLVFASLHETALAAAASAWAESMGLLFAPGALVRGALALSLISACVLGLAAWALGRRSRPVRGSCSAPD
ncbi:MAG: FHA domain-containing protein [Wenzhouxiangellaceae bacterium]